MSRTKPIWPHKFPLQRRGPRAELRLPLDGLVPVLESLMSPAWRRTSQTFEEVPSGQLAGLH